MLQNLRSWLFAPSLRLGLRMLCAAAIVQGAQTVIGSGWVKDFIGFKYVYAQGFNTNPMEWLWMLMLLFTMYHWRSYAAAQPAPIPEPCRRVEEPRGFSFLQVGLGLCMIVLAVALSIVITHPNLQWQDIMHDFAKENALVGSPLVASFLSFSLMWSLPGAMVLLLPGDWLAAHWRSIILFVIGLAVCLFVSVFEALYHRLFAIALLQATAFFLSFFTTDLSVDVVRWVLRVKTFTVTVGPACSGLGYLLLFTCFFIAMVHRIGEHGSIRRLRTATLYCAGIVGTFLLNALRIASIMAVGTANPKLAMNLFHSSIGAILFFLFFVLFLEVTKRWYRCKPA